MEKYLKQMDLKKQVDGSILISDKTDFKPRLIITYRGGHYIFINGNIHQGNFVLLNIYAANTRAPKFIKETLPVLKSHVDSCTLIVGDFNIPLLSKDVHPGPN